MVISQISLTVLQILLIWNSLPLISKMFSIFSWETLPGILYESMWNVVWSSSFFLPQCPIVSWYLGLLSHSASNVPWLSTPLPPLLLCSLCTWQSSALGSLHPEEFATREGGGPDDSFPLYPAPPPSSSSQTFKSSWYRYLPSQQALLLRLILPNLSLVLFLSDVHHLFFQSTSRNCPDY